MLGFPQSVQCTMQYIMVALACHPSISVSLHCMAFQRKRTGGEYLVPVALKSSTVSACTTSCSRWFHSKTSFLNKKSSSLIEHCGTALCHTPYRVFALILHFYDFGKPLVWWVYLFVFFFFFFWGGGGYLWLSVSHEPFSLFHHGVFIWLECFSMIIHCIS